MELDRELPSSSSSSSLSPTSSSLKQKLRSSICFSCCFNVHGGSGQDGGGGGGDDCEDRPIPIARLLPELGERWRDVVARIGSRRRRLAGEFRYDPLSYSLNFDEGAAADDDDGPLAGDGFQVRNFSSRLPPSPPLTAAAPAIA